MGEMEERESERIANRMVALEAERRTGVLGVGALVFCNVFGQFGVFVVVYSGWLLENTQRVGRKVETGGKVDMI